MTGKGMSRDMLCGTTFTRLFSPFLSPLSIPKPRRSYLFLWGTVMMI